MAGPLAQDDPDPGGWGLVRAGAAAAVPIAVGVIPFGLVAGAAPVEAGGRVVDAVGFSVFVFAGASQLAAIDLLDGGGTVAVAVVSALMINLRFLMYSASLAPHLAGVPVPSRLTSAYVLTDQAFAVSIARYGDDRPPPTPQDRLRYYLGAAWTFWSVWQVSTIVGAVGGGSIPDSVPLDFAIPLAFLALLVPAIGDRATLVAAVVGGLATVAAAELGAGDLSLVLGASSGIVAGVLAGAGDGGADGRAGQEEDEP